MSPRTNRLAAEKSPYLQQHAANPVDWYPWGSEAFAAAKAADKPIFLSIGYSTCHWCHVMAHESFENPAVAEVMNRRYINIKVDREERPDVDALYMTAVQALTGSGGWPMSVWLTPDLKPFYGGTYFPPEERWGRPGFPDVMEQLADIYAKERDRVSEASSQISDMLRRVAAGDGAAGLPSAEAAMSAAFAGLEASFDARHGGFSPAPKFPMPVYLEFLLDHHARTGETRALDMAAFSFREMAQGGLYDHLGGGFARYSTDGEWLVPHFEKMLYDNAQLLRAGAALWAATGDSFIRDAVRGTAAYLARDLRHPDGGFFSAEDADSEGKEGTFYLWTLAQFRTVLGDDADAAAERYGVTAHGNFQDPHTGDAGQNVLSLKGGAPKDPAAFDALRRRLFDARLKRPRPHRDEKILTEWNGLAISGLSRAGFLLDDGEMIAAANAAADFVEKHLYDAASGRLYRRWRDGDRAVDGQLADHAMFVEGLLDLFEVTGDAGRLSLATTLQRRANDLFLDADAGGYFTSAAAPDLLVRMKEDGDNVIPSGNATAARNGFRLAAMTGDDVWRRPAEATLRFFAAALSRRPSTITRMTPLLAWAEGLFREIVVVGDPSQADTRALLDVLRSAAPRDAVVIPALGGKRPGVNRLLPGVGALPASPSPAAYVCRRFSCLAPAVDAASLRTALSS